MKYLIIITIFVLVSQQQAAVRQALQRQAGGGGAAPGGDGGGDLNAQLVAKCPRCRVQTLKQGTNNHLRCWNCRANYCFMCKALIVGNIASHFNAMMPCDQHSVA